LLENHIESLKIELDEKIVRGHKLLAYLKSSEVATPWEIGMTEGKLLTFEFCRGKLETDDIVRGDMFEAVMDRLMANRLTDTV